jgi:hypothetical protein
MDTGWCCPKQSSSANEPRRKKLLGNLHFLTLSTNQLISNGNPGMHFPPLVAIE